MIFNKKTKTPYIGLLLRKTDENNFILQLIKEEAMKKKKTQPEILNKILKDYFKIDGVNYKF
jgi:hypothetical protein